MAALLRRLIGLVVVLLAMTLIVFLLEEIVPGDPARAALGPNAPRAAVEAKRVEMGLDRPVLERYARYLGRLARGDLGVSARTHDSVAADLGRLAPASLELALAAMPLGLLLGAVLALSADARWGASPARLVLLTGASAPIFLVAMLLALLFWFELGWLPGSGRTSLDDAPASPTGFLTLDGLLAGRPRVTLDALAHLVLPATALALPLAVAIGRTLRSSMLTVLRQNHVRTARAKGLRPARIVLRHVLRNAAQAPLAMAGLQVGLLLANLLIVERIFAWPGLGMYAVQATASSDLPAVLGVSLVFAVCVVAANALVDVVQLALDPRLRAG